MRTLRYISVALLSSACSTADEPGGPQVGLELLARAPDAMHWQAGELVPAASGAPWGALGQFGWHGGISSSAGCAFVWTNREKAYLRLPAGAPTARVLSLKLIGTAGLSKRVQVRLNSTLLESAEVGGEFLEQSLSVPATLWVEGDNLLELSCALGPEPALGIGIARVGYDTRREVGVDTLRRRVRLDAGTGVSYRIEPLAAGRVALRARAAGAGTLAATLAPIDRASGAEQPGEHWTVALAGGRALERSFALPADGRLFELRLAWKPPAGTTDAAELVLERLVLEETVPAARPSLVLISIDTLSARHMSVYGYALDTTPSLARLARESVVFEHCLTNAPWTLPSFLTLMTGTYARAHAPLVAGLELWEQWYLAPNRWTLAELLRAAGYRTAGFVDNSWLTEALGFPQGFDVYDASAADNNDTKLVAPDGGIHQTTAAARAYLAGLAPDAPFFLFVHGFDVHGPYAAPSPFDGRFDAAPSYDQERKARAGGSTFAFGIIPTYIARGEVRAGPLPNLMRTAPFEGAYDEGVLFSDDEVGKFIEHLRASGVLERAWLIVTADHGETMADTSFLFGHGVMEEDVLRVPLLIRPPGGMPGGARIAETVQLADLYPTVLDLLDSRASREHLHGQSLLPFLEGRSRPGSVVLSEAGLMPQTALVNGRWKLVEFERLTSSLVLTSLSHPALTREWLEGMAAGLLQHLGAGAESAEAQRLLLGWRQDEELARDLFERLPATGMTEELWNDLQSRKGFASLTDMLTYVFESPIHELYDLEQDPEARRDVAHEFPEVLAEMKRLLAREQARREQARQLARAPIEPIALSPEVVEDLRALGYGGEPGEDE